MRVCPLRRPGLSKQSACRFLFGLLALWSLGTAGLPDAAGDIQQPPRATAPGERRVQRRPNAPASALPEEVTVDEGGQAVIVLSGAGQTGKTLDFYIRAIPQHGVLSEEPVRISRDSVSYEYTQNAGDLASDDQFSFCVKTPGSALSAPETVHIRILPSAALLSVTPYELDFGAVKAGDTARAEVTVENRGGTTVTGELQPPKPWTVEGPANYRLGRGDSQTFQIVFRPKDEQVYNDTLHLRYESGGGVRLVGTGLADPTKIVAKVPVPAATPEAVTTEPSGSGNGSLTLSPVVSASPAAPATGAAAAGRNGSAPGRTAPAAGGPVAGTDGPGRDPSLATLDATSVPLNEASVKAVEVRNVGSSTVDLRWKPPVPKPASYRVEIQYISVEDDKVRVDWRPYALTDFHVTPDLVTASLRGLPSTNLQMMRVVAVDGAGRLASPSPTVVAAMHLPSTWWRPTLLKVLVFLLMICGGLVIYKRREDRLILASIDESRRESNREAGLVGRR